MKQESKVSDGYDEYDDYEPEAEDETEEVEGGSIKITVDVTPYANLDGRIVDAAASQVVGRMDPIRDQIQEAVTAKVEEKMGEIVSAAFDEIIQPTDRYGKPNAPAISMRAHMVELAEGYLDQPVNAKDGKPYEACGYNQQKTTRALWLSKHCAAEVWSYELKQVVDKELGKLKEAIHKQAVTHFAAKLYDLIGGDKK